MNIVLSPDEIKYAKIKIKYYDDRSRKWIYLRLVLLIVAILCISTSGRCLWALENQNKKEETFTKSTSFESVTNECIKNYIDKKSEYNSIQNKAVFIGFTNAIIGILSLFFTISQWNLHKNEPLEIKIYKLLIESEACTTIK